MDQDFELASLSGRAIISHLKDTGKDYEISDLVKTYEEALENLNKNGKTYNAILIDKLYINCFGLFEEYISNCFKILFKSFPKYMANEEFHIEFWCRVQFFLMLHPL